MNTQIKLWIEPMEMSHERCNNRVYFNCIIEGDETTKNNAELEDLLSGRIINSQKRSLKILLIRVCVHPKSLSQMFRLRKLMMIGIPNKMVINYLVSIGCGVPCFVG